MARFRWLSIPTASLRRTSRTISTYRKPNVRPTRCEICLSVSPSITRAAIFASRSGRAGAGGIASTAHAGRRNMKV